MGRSGQKKKCYTCNKWGNITTLFPEESSRTGRQGFHIGLSFMQQETLTKDMTLLDSCTTDGWTNNLDMIKDLKTCTRDDTLHLETNGGMIFLINVVLEPYWMYQFTIIRI